MSDPRPQMPDGDGANPIPAEPSTPSQPSLRQVLGPYDGIIILVAVTIGAGIYAAPQDIAGNHSSFNSIVLLWVMGGVFAFTGGLVYSELGTRLPFTGGEYVYLTRCFGPHVGFLFGWKDFFLTNPASRAGLAIVTADYVGHFFELNGRLHTLVAIGIIGFVGTLNYLGIHWTFSYQKWTAVLKVAGLLALMAFGFMALRSLEPLLFTRSPAIGTLGPAGNAAASLLLIYYAYTGWERIGYVAGEMKTPRRTVPLAMFGLGSVVVLYLLMNMLYHSVLGMEGVRASDRVLSDTAVAILGSTGAAFVALLVIVSLTGSMNVSVMACTRLYFAMAKDGLFFRAFNHIHPVFRTPSRAIIGHCVVAILMLLARKNFVNLITSVMFIGLMFSALNTIALFKLRRHGVGGPNAYRIPLYPWLPGLYLVGILALLVVRLIFDWERAWFDLLVVGAGIPAAVVWCRRRQCPDLTLVK